MHLSATSIIGNEVVGMGREVLGEVEDLMINVSSSRVEYAVVSFGGFLGLGEKLFAVPLAALTVDTAEKCFVLPVDEEKLKNAPGFERSNWPDTANLEWRDQVNAYYANTPGADG